MPWDDRDKGQGGSLEYNLTITESKVDTTDYNDGNTTLWILEGEQEFDNGNIRDTHLWIGAPDGWTFNDDHTGFEDEQGDDDRRFGKNSKIQQFINSALDIPELEEVIHARTDNSLDVAGWAGLKLRIREEEKSADVKNKESGKSEKRTWRQPLVIEFLGLVDEEKPASKGKGKVKVVEAPSDASNGNGGGDLVSRAKAIATESGDLITYMDKVSKELGIPLDHQLCSSSFYESANA